MTWCTNCGHELAPDQAFCIECGSPAPKAGGTPTATCARCATELPAGATFCVECGTTVTPQTADHGTCGVCGWDISTSDTFCGHCGSGHAVDPEAAGDATTVPKTATLHKHVPRFVDPETDAPTVTPPAFCIHCGHHFTTNDTFCIRCGRQRSESRADATVAATGVPATHPNLPAAATESGGKRRGGLIAIVVLLSVAVLAAGGWFAFTNLFADSDEPPTDAASTATRETTQSAAPPTSPIATEEDQQQATTTATPTTAPPTTQVTTTSVAPTTQPPVSLPLTPESIVASATRAPVQRLRCGGSNSFEAALLIDGDFDTGWGAGSGDGSGQWVRIDFAAELHLTRIGLTPGYVRLAPRYDQGCKEVLAFDYNRFVGAVEYRFDDGTTLRHNFVQEPTLQFIDIDVVTRSVTITILSTVKTVDNDTIISEAAFFGYTP